MNPAQQEMLVKLDALLAAVAALHALLSDVQATAINAEVAASRAAEGV